MTVLLDSPNTISLIFPRGADASTTLTDESGKVWTARGNAQLDTGIASPLVNGQATMLFDGTGDYFDTPDHADWANIKSLELWVYHTTVSANQVYFSQWTDGNNGHRFFLSSAGDLFYQIYSGGVAVVEITAASGFSTSTWYHLAVVHNGTDYRIWKNGASLVNGTDSDNLGNYTGVAVIGADAGGVPGASYMSGSIAQFRASLAVLYTAAFVPRRTEYTNGSFF